MEEIVVALDAPRKRAPKKRSALLVFSLCFLAPLIVVTWASLSSLPHAQMVRIALFSSAIGFGCFFVIYRRFEKRMQKTVELLVKKKGEELGMHSKNESEQKSREHKEEMGRQAVRLQEERHHFEHQIDLLQSLNAKSKERVEELSVELENKLEEARLSYLEFDDLRQESERIKEEKAAQEEQMQEELKHKEALLSDYHHTITEQRMVIEKKQRYIGKLESKVHDLMYEIKSLLQLEESPAVSLPVLLEAPALLETSTALPFPSQPTSYDLSLVLQNYVEMAERFTGAAHLGYRDGKSPRFLDPSLDSYAIDLRHLFDFLQSESVGIVFVYALSAGKMLFVNNLAKTLLGFSPDKVAQEFASLILEGGDTFKQTLFSLPARQEGETRLVLRHKQGEVVPFQCLLRIVTKGPFSHHAIGLLTKEEKSF